VQFLDVLDRLIPASVLEQMCEEYGPRARGAPKLPAAKLLARVRDNIQIEVLERLSDGSALVEVPVREGKRIVAVLKVREIQAHGVGVNG
jgi:hypothetical protein